MEKTANGPLTHAICKNQLPEDYRAKCERKNYKLSKENKRDLCDLGVEYDFLNNMWKAIPIMSIKWIITYIYTKGVYIYISYIYTHMLRTVFGTS